MKNNNKTLIDTTEKFQGGERFAKMPAWEVLERQVYLWNTRARCIPLLPEEGKAKGGSHKMHSSESGWVTSGTN